MGARVRRAAVGLHDVAVVVEHKEIAERTDLQTLAVIRDVRRPTAHPRLVRNLAELDERNADGRDAHKCVVEDDRIADRDHKLQVVNNKLMCQK